DRLVPTRLPVPAGEPVALREKRMPEVRGKGLEVCLARFLELLGRETVYRGENPLVGPLVVGHQPPQLLRVGHARRPLSCVSLASRRPTPGGWAGWPGGGGGGGGRAAPACGTISDGRAVPARPRRHPRREHDTRRPMKITEVRTIPLSGATHDHGWPGG